MARLRRLEGVQRVSVAASDKQDSSSGAASSQSDSGGSGGSAAGCQTDDQVPQFQMVVFFGTPQAAATESSATGVKGAIQTLNEGTSGTTTTTPGS